MTSATQKPLTLSIFLGDRCLESEAPSAAEVVAMAQRPDAQGGASIYPRSEQFPRAHLSVHPPHGLLLQCWEDESSWSDFLAEAVPQDPPTVEIEHGGQALELWPRQLFVPADLAIQALDHFLEHRLQRPDLTWVRIDGFSRKVIWEGREQREAWERSRLFGGDA